MKIDELTTYVLALAPSQRAELAQKVWQSLEDSQVVISPQAEAEALELSRRRDTEIEDGEVETRSHDDVMKDARQSMKCE